MKRLLAFILVGAAIAVPGMALAMSPSTSMNVTLAKGENHSGTYYATGQTITVDGDVNGDVICAGQTVVINGSVSGDVICGAQDLTINGPVTGSIRVVGQTVALNGTVGRNVTIAGQSITTGSGARVSGDVDLGGQSVSLGGPIDGHVYAAAQSLTLGSTIGGNVNVRVSDLTMSPAATIAGDLAYTSDKTFAVNSQVKGSVTRHAAPQHRAAPNKAAVWLGFLIYSILAVLASTLLVVWLLPRLVRSVTDIMVRRVGPSLGWGFLVLIAAPALLIVVALTVIGIPLALFTGTLWVLALIASGGFAGVAVGRILLGRKAADQKNLALAALVGVPIVELAIWIPWLGALVGLAVGAWALGGMLLSLNRARLA